MKTLRFAVLGLLLSTVSCSSWLTQAEANPQAAVAQIANVVSAIITTAQLVFDTVKASLPADAASADQAKLDTAVAVLEHAMTVLENAVQAALEAKDKDVNLSTLEADVQAAVSGVVAIIDDIRGVSSDAGALTKIAAASAGPYADLKTQANLITRIH